MNAASRSDYFDEKKPTIIEKILFPGHIPDKKKLKKIVDGKTILITGASFGIGALLAEKLSDYNSTLLLVARTGEKLKQMQESFREKPCCIYYFSTDLRNENDVRELLEKFREQQFNIDIYVNNAGKSINRGMMNSLDRFHDITRSSSTNFTGPAQLLLGILANLINQKGHIINVSAINVLLPPTAGWSAYQSSKVAFDQWLKCLEPELRAQDVKVSSIYFPLVRTRMSMVNKKNHTRPSMSKNKAVDIILKFVISRRRKYKPWWTGSIEFLNLILPGLWYRLQVNHQRKKMRS